MWAPAGVLCCRVYLDGTRKAAAKGRASNLSDHRIMDRFVGLIAGALDKPRPSLRLAEGPARFAAGTLGKLPGFLLAESRVDALTTRVIYR